MADLTLRFPASQFRALMAAPSAAPSGARGKRGPKFGNRKVVNEDGKFDSEKEYRVFQMLQLARAAREPAQRVVKIDRQSRYEVIDKQPGERAVFYVADFVVTYADQRVEVIDAKSAITRINRVYVLKRKLMLSRYGIKVREI